MMLCGAHDKNIDTHLKGRLSDQRPIWFIFLHWLKSDLLGLISSIHQVAEVFMQQTEPVSTPEYVNIHIHVDCWFVPLPRLRTLLPTCCL